MTPETETEVIFFPDTGYRDKVLLFEDTGYRDRGETVVVFFHDTEATGYRDKFFHDTEDTGYTDRGGNLS
jgi:hypothetical protein